MNEIKMIENELVPVYETDKGIKVVYGSELHQVLEVRSNYREWIARRLNDIDAVENVDFEGVEISTVVGGTPRKEHVIKLETAKEMAMLERNEKGKQVRKYFISVEEKYKQEVVDRKQLSPQMQMFYAIADEHAKMELEQKRQAEQINRIEQKQAEIEKKQEVIAETFQNNNDIEDFQVWAKNCLAKIADSGNYRMDLSRNERHRVVTTDSYIRLVKKANCRLELLVANAQARALQNNPGIRKSELNKITKLYVIAHDKKLKIAYELIIKEMMMCYCAEVY